MLSLTRWNLWHAVIAGVLILEPLFLQSITLFALVAATSIVLFFFTHFEKNPFFLGGPANWVTLLRLLGLVALGLSYSHLSLITVGVCLAVLIALDGVDGWLARRFDTASECGSYFDMETDAFLVALVSGMLYVLGIASVWVLLAGFLRYFYGVLRIVLGLGTVRERSFFMAKVIAAVFFISLTVALFSQHDWIRLLLHISSGLIVISFACSFYWLLTDSG